MLFSRDEELLNLRTDMIMDGNLGEAVCQILKESHDDNGKSDNLVTIQSMNTTVSNMNYMSAM
ncbi:hypothetical protein [Limosilactobacillus reuteri]|uniref:hypothetical protein n=1 Tax=Limosilactobacillus reuteri TaxID=1598 RepID=UPI001E5A510C|nr:hypothetical protein [Limosilactobacillus reuteri]